MKQKKMFKKFYIEITNICNLTCSFCPISTRKLEFMSPELFEKIVIDAKQYTDYIYLHVKGEPLLHPNLDEILSISSKYQLNVTITTNGTLIEKQRDVLLKHPCIRQINISIHSFFANRNPSDRFADLQQFVDSSDYFQDIYNFSNLALTQSKMNLSYRLWNLNRANQHSICENEITEEMLSDENKAILHSLENHYQMQLKYPLLLGNQLTKRVYLNFEEQFQWPDLTLEVLSQQGFCYGLRNQIAVLVDGSVVPCCLDNNGVVTLGNMNHQSLEDILNGERAQAMIHGFSNRMVTEELCQKCGFRERFNH